MIIYGAPQDYQIMQDSHQFQTDVLSMISGPTGYLLRRGSPSRSNADAAHAHADANVDAVQ